MNKENVLFSLVGVGFGLFFGFMFVTWANQKAQTKPRAAATTNENQQATTDGRPSAAEIDAAVKRAQENPKEYDAQMQAARALYDAQRYDESIQLLLKANELDQKNREPVVALGEVNAEAGNLKAAEKWYVAALDMKPDDANARADLARVLLISAPPDYERAVAELRRALKDDPKNEPALQFLAFALAHQKDERGARDALAQLEKINPDNPVIPRLREEIDAQAGASKTNANPGG